MEKLKGDLRVVRENITVTNDMINTNEGDATKNETLTELVNTL